MPRVFRLKVSLVGTVPEVWRRLEVPAELTLAGLHELIQLSMGWQEESEHAFEIGSRRTGQINPDNLWQVGSESLATVEDLLSRRGLNLHYLLGLLSPWDHLIEIEDIVDGAGHSEASCTGGAGACPPAEVEDLDDYLDLLDALIDAGQPGHRDALRRLGENWQPERFDLTVVLQELAEADRESWRLGEEDYSSTREIPEGLGEIYDAALGPDPGVWLNLDQGDMILAIEHHHVRERLRSRSSGLHSHAVVHMAVETQLAEDHPSESRQALERLRAQGLDRHEAVHALGAVFSAHLGQAVRTDHFDQQGYARDLAQLDAEAWRKGLSLGLIPAVMQRGLRRRRRDSDDPGRDDGSGEA